MTARLCQRITELKGRPCPNQAMWIVQIGARKSDAEQVCGVHLSRACEAMLGAENRPVPLTVWPV